MARQGLSLEKGTWYSGKSILTRGGFEGLPITLDESAFTNGVCKAGTPVDRDGKIANDGTVYGILLHDVVIVGDIKDPSGVALKKAYVSLTYVEESSGLTISPEVKAALPMIVWE